MITLAIETATAACSVALLRDGQPLAHAHEVVGRGHAERLVPMIGEVLAAAQVNRPDRILADCGPGSFTGIRVGLAAARALALAWGVEAQGYSALALLAATAGEECAVAMTGGHGELFVQRFAGDPIREVSELRSLPPVAAAELILDDLVLGSGAAALVAARGSGRAVDTLPDAAETWRLPVALAGLLLRPIYGRPPDAALPR